MSQIQNGLWSLCDHHSEGKHGIMCKDEWQRFIPLFKQYCIYTLEKCLSVKPLQADNIIRKRLHSTSQTLKFEIFLYGANNWVSLF